ncbi:MAG: hypothetical protein JNM66_20940 [Bryobacterales bacterium]|nr:hypothetical protein [Bryobacterales bacterium]
MKRSILVIWALATLAVGGTAWWYLFSAGTVPAGQRPLGDAAVFRDAFQKGVGKNRIVAVLSPGTAADLLMAMQVQSLLTEYENDAMDAHIIWQPETRNDWAPTTDAMARVWDSRARHYWDKDRTMSATTGAGRAFVYARGAGLDTPAIRVNEWEASLPKVREFLGTPKKMQ